MSWHTASLNLNCNFSKKDPDQSPFHLVTVVADLHSVYVQHM